jgi:hypothetical protein
VTGWKGFHTVIFRFFQAWQECMQHCEGVHGNYSEGDNL